MPSQTFTMGPPGSTVLDNKRSTLSTLEAAHAFALFIVDMADGNEEMARNTP
jgi:hypothetical protein